MGGGPIGCELAQAHRRLGTPSPCSSATTILPKDDPDAVEVVRRALLADGVDLREGVEVRRVEPRGNRIAVFVGAKGAEETAVEGSHLLVAAGRQANVEGLASRPPGSSTPARASRPTSRSGPRTRRSGPSATSPAASSSPTSPATTRAS
jgi:pyruvate/2-oxoglutarate dehydrogenase complex dihydrolipoamide dehydrogenase (E3) component